MAWLGHVPIRSCNMRYDCQCLFENLAWHLGLRVVATRHLAARHRAGAAMGCFAPNWGGDIGGDHLGSSEMASAVCAGCALVLPPPGTTSILDRDWGNRIYSSGSQCVPGWQSIQCFRPGRMVVASLLERPAGLDSILVAPAALATDEQGARRGIGHNPRTPIYN